MNQLETFNSLMEFLGYKCVGSKPINEIDEDYLDYVEVDSRIDCGTSEDERI